MIRNTVIGYVLLLFASCSYVFYPHFMEIGKVQHRFPHNLLGDWTITGKSLSYISAIRVYKRAFTISLAGNPNSDQSFRLSSDSARCAADEGGWYFIQLRSKDGISLHVFRLRSDTLTVFNPDLRHINKVFGTKENATAFGEVAYLNLSQEQAEIISKQPTVYFLPGDKFVKR